MAVPFACPVHKTTLDEGLGCPHCVKPWSKVGDVLVLINDANSVFCCEDYLAQRGYDGASGYAGSLDERRGWRQWYRRAVFALAESAPAREFDVERAVAQIVAERPQAEILLIGAGDTKLPGRVTYTDVAFGANVQCIADAHDLPFVDHSFDACVAVAVLEHVVDPWRCVAEIVRVLKPGGWVYAETPFLQPVHMRQHDFTRFTHLGHRRLFRRFDEIRSGIAIGPAASAALALRYALLATSDAASMRRWLKLAGLLLTYPLRWLDRMTRSRQSAYDSASAFYFFGRLRPDAIPDREVLRSFRGA